MTIIREKTHSRNFTILMNEVLQDKNLSGKARGYWAYLMSLPDDWDISARSMVQCFPEGYDAIMSGLKELESNGYAEFKQPTNKQGRFQYGGWRIFESKKFVPQRENPLTENTPAENPDTHKYYHTKDYHKKNNNNIEDRDDPPPQEAKDDVVVVFSCLENVQVPDDLKSKITKTFPEEKVQKAVKWYLSHLKTHGCFKKGREQAIWWACTAQPEVEVTQDPDKLRSFNREAVIAKLKTDWGELKTKHGQNIQFRVGYDMLTFMDSIAGTTFDLKTQNIMIQIDKYLNEHYRM